MEITISGKIYIEFIKSSFINNKKNGIELIINHFKSDFNVIDGLKRINMINNNKIHLLNNNYPIDINTIKTKYLSDVEFKVIDNTIKLTFLKIDKIDKEISLNTKINKSIYFNKFATSKNKTINDIMNILKQDVMNN